MKTTEILNPDSLTGCHTETMTVFVCKPVALLHEYLAEPDMNYVRNCGVVLSCSLPLIGRTFLSRHHIALKYLRIHSEHLLLCVLLSELITVFRMKN